MKPTPKCGDNVDREAAESGKNGRLSDPDGRRNGVFFTRVAPMQTIRRQNVGERWETLIDCGAEVGKWAEFGNPRM